MCTNCLTVDRFGLLRYVAFKSYHNLKVNLYSIIRIESSEKFSVEPKKCVEKCVKLLVKFLSINIILDCNPEPLVDL